MQEIKRPESTQPIPPHAKKVFEGVIFDVYQWEQEMFNGTKATFEKLKRESPAAIAEVIEFLSAGRSDSPRNLLARLGIDITRPEFWHQGLAVVDSFVTEAETLARSLGKIA